MSASTQAVSCVLLTFLSTSAGVPSGETPSGENAKNPVQQAKGAQDMAWSPVIDFDKAPEPWRIVNDGVMGGLSSSCFEVKKGIARFEGTVSLENNGGFASARSRPQEHDLSTFQGLLLRVRGDGKRYALRLRNTSAFGGISYQVRFKTVPDQWITIRIPFKAFQPVFRGRLAQGAEPLDLKSVKTFGFLISEKQAGAFRLEIDWVKAYMPTMKG